MELDAIRAGAAVGLAVAMPVGPIGLLVVGLGSRDWRSGGAAACGVAAADLTWAAVAVTGEAAIAALPGTAVWRTIAKVALVGIGVLLVAWGIRRLRVERDEAVVAPTPPRRPGWWFPVLYGLTLPNPLTVAVFAAAALSIGVGDRPTDRLLFVVAVGTTSLLWQLLLAALGRHVLARTGPVVEGLLTAAAGAVLIAWPLLG